MQNTSAFWEVLGAITALSPPQDPVQAALYASYSGIGLSMRGFGFDPNNLTDGVILGMEMGLAAGLTCIIGAAQTAQAAAQTPTLWQPVSGALTYGHNCKSSHHSSKHPWQLSLNQPCFNFMHHWCSPGCCPGCCTDTHSLWQPVSGVFDLGHECRRSGPHCQCVTALLCLLNLRSRRQRHPQTAQHDVPAQQQKDFAKTAQGDSWRTICTAPDKLLCSAHRCGQGDWCFRSARGGSSQYDCVLPHPHWHRERQRRIQRRAECEPAQLHCGFPGHSTRHSGMEVRSPSICSDFASVLLMHIGTAPVMLYGS